MKIKQNDNLMLEFIKNQEHKTNRAIHKIETSEDNILKRLVMISILLEELFYTVKEHITRYQFTNEKEEILFFKEIKPRIFCKLIFYKNLYNIEINRPICGPEAVRDYLNNELHNIQDYINKRMDFYRYYRSGATHMDHIYFLRNSPAPYGFDQYIDSFHFERDPAFSTYGDFHIANILANDMLRSYILNELNKIENRLLQTTPLLRMRLTWKGSKAQLNELLYALDSMKCFGDIPLTQLYNYIQNVFNIELDHNLSRVLNDMRLRNNKTPFLDELKTSLVKRMNKKNIK